ncbi:MAG: ATP-binding cassette domain-containing protein [Actinobacteria bacterium]|nr:MAG: ATP-binding cassette domain-containing protein [Actinomycetota bacterium]
MPSASSARAEDGPAAVFNACDVSYNYAPGVCALEAASFDVRAGEQLAILGANGSGKSTLLSLLDGLIFPSSGTLTAFGADLTEDVLRGDSFRKAFRSRVGFVFQDSDAQLFNATVREEIAFGPLQLDLGQEEALARTDEVIRMLGLGAVAERPPFLLSGGEKKKVAIASVLVVNPSVLLLDEPTTGLDPRTQVWLQELLWELADAGKTVVMATHDLSLAEDCSDRALVLDEAHRVVTDRPVAEVLDDVELLLEVNLIHEHAHRHESRTHVHPHRHDYGHAHSHDRPKA